MNITDIRVRKIWIAGKMKAIVSVTLDAAFVIHGIKVVEGANGLFVAMPSQKTPNGEFRDIAHPISREAREQLQTSVLKKYEEALAGYKKNAPTEYANNQFASAEDAWS